MRIFHLKATINFFIFIFLLYGMLMLYFTLKNKFINKHLLPSSVCADNDLSYSAGG